MCDALTSVCEVKASQVRDIRENRRPDPGTP
jgi:hypothetical protein